MDEVKREYAGRALDLHEGNTAATARALGLAVNTLRSYQSDGAVGRTG
jgi:ActR/RegA family two-component response regulator